MPVECIWHNKKNYLESRLTGVISKDDLFCHLESAYAVLKDKTNKRELVDLSGVEKLDVESEAFDNGAKKEIDNFAGILDRKVSVYAPTDFLYGISRMFELMLSSKGYNNSVRIFRNLHDAMTWLLNNDEEAV